MKTAVRLYLLSTILAPSFLAQKNSNPKASEPYETQISAGVAEKLLIHKADPVCPHLVMPARITGTVVVGFDIDRKGNVIQPSVISGPAMLRKPVLDAVRKYKYNPYLLNGKAVEVETIASVAMDSYLDCHYR